MSEYDVQHEVASGKGRFFIQHPDGVSELTYTITSPTLVIADHTDVAKGYEGQGVGLALLDHLIKTADASGFKIMPLCPFVNAQRRRHPEWAAYFAV